MDLSYSPPISALSSAVHRRQTHKLLSCSPPTCSTSSSSSYFGISLSNYKRSTTSPIHLSRRSKRSFYVVSGVFERFTERSIKAVMFAQREAKAFGVDSVMTQHLLLGLVMEDRAPGGFLASGVTIEVARKAVTDLFGGVEGESVESASATEVPFSKETKRVFEAAVEYSRENGYNFIAPEHIAIGLFTVDDGNAARVLKRLGVNANFLASVAISRLQGELAKEGRGPAAAPLKKARDVPDKLSQSKSNGRSKENNKALDQFCVDLTARASAGLIDPVIGRGKEVQRVVEILCRRTKSNPILLGEAGVGKTAIAEGVAISISDGSIPFFLMDKRVFSLDIGLLIAGAKERGELEGRVTSIIKEIKKSGNIILFIDEVHTLIGSGTVGRGSKGSGLDIGNLLKPALGRGEMQCIASTTLDEFRLHFEKDKALARRFQPVLINEPSQEDAVQILLGLREKYEAHHKCSYTLEAINSAVELSARYIPDRYLPDKAIDLIDEAGSRASMESSKRRKALQTSILSKPPNDYWQEIRAVHAMHDASVAIDQSGNGNASWKREDGKTKSDPPSRNVETTMVGPEDIAAVASLWSGIPVKKLTEDERMLLVGLNERLKKRVIGQDEAISVVCRAVKRSRVGLKDPNRPIGAMLFCGPTGVGKTELTKALAENFFGSESAMLRLDMSEYMEQHTVSKLIGSPPGYVGYGEGGTLTEAIRKKPFTVVLLDEIEKAHSAVFNILLQLFEDGHLTDSQGRRVSFKNALIVMTSNIGSKAIAKGRSKSKPFGLVHDDEDESTSYDGMKSLVVEEVKKYFRPELLNRMDEIVVFHALEKPQMHAILDIMLREVKGRLTSMGIGLEVSEPVMNLICEQGYDRSYGARPLRRAVTQMIEDLISESILSGEFKRGDVAYVHLDDKGNPVVTNQLNQKIELSDTHSIL